MSGPKKDKVILSEQGIVTEEALTAYLQNKLSPDDRLQLEKLLQEDPFAQDALEGLKSSLNQTTVKASISSLNKKVRERSGLKERKKLEIHWVNYAWAAVVLGLLIGIGFIMVNFLDKKTDNLALNEKKEMPAAPALQPKDTVSISAKPETLTTDSNATKRVVADTLAIMVSKNVAVSKQEEQKPVLQTEKDLKKTEAAKQAAAPIDAMQTKNAIAKNAPENLQKKDDKQNNVKSPVAGVNERAPAAADKEVKAKKTEDYKQEVRDPAALQDEAMKSFNSGDYNTAADGFDKILKHDPENADALYFGGISDYINGKTVKSESNFDKLLKKGSKYQEGSKWYKANILIKKGHSEAAKALLQDLTNTNGSYKERAIKKLAEMGF